MSNNRPKKKIRADIEAAGGEWSDKSSAVELEAYLAELNAPLESDSQESGEPAESKDDDGEPERIESEERLQAPERVEVASDEPVGDYLQKYQYRKNTAFGSVGSNPVKGSNAAIMKAKLLDRSIPEGEVCNLFIPMVAGETAGILESVNLDGYRLDLPKQEYLKLPRQVCDVVMKSLNQTGAAILRGQIEGNQAKEDALL